jgi:hypothetical protein
MTPAAEDAATAVAAAADTIVPAVDLAIDAEVVDATTPEGAAAAAVERASATTSSSSQQQQQHPYKVMDTVYVREGDGIMYKAIIRRALLGRQFKRPSAQLAMGEQTGDDNDDYDKADNDNDGENGNHINDTIRDDEDIDNDDDEDTPSSCPAMWHYFVHFPGWKVSRDRWASQADVFDVDAETTAYVERLNQEHKALYKSMSSAGNKTKVKRQQKKVSGVQFLTEWSKRLHQITSELPAGGMLRAALDRWQASRQHASTGGTRKKESPAAKQPVKTDTATASPPTNSQPKKQRRNNNNKKDSLLIPLSPELVQNEVRFRHEGLTTGRLWSLSKMMTNIPLPLGLKTILVEQWELIFQC